MKRLLAVLLACMMLLALSSSVFAGKESRYLKRDNRMRSPVFAQQVSESDEDGGGFTTMGAIRPTGIW